MKFRSFVLSHRPYKLLLASTGTIPNTELDALFVPNIPAIVTALQSHDYIELTRTVIVVHG